MVTAVFILLWCVLVTILIQQSNLMEEGFQLWFKGTVHHGRNSSWLRWHMRETDQEAGSKGSATQAISLPSLFTQLDTTAHRMLLPTFSIDLPISGNSLWNHPHKNTQRYMSLMSQASLNQIDNPNKPPHSREMKQQHGYQSREDFRQPFSASSRSIKSA
jgi:hypothetical protein